MIAMRALEIGHEELRLMLEKWAAEKVPGVISKSFLKVEGGRVVLMCVVDVGQES